MEKASEFIEKHTKSVDGKKYIDAVEAIIELYSRILSLQNSVKSINEALGDYGAFCISIEERVNKLEGNKKIEIVSPDQAKNLLK